MKHRIRLDLAFDSQDAVDDILDKALDHFQDASTINPGTPHEEKGFILAEKCYHDQDPATSCDLIASYFTQD